MKKILQFLLIFTIFLIYKNAEGQTPTPMLPGISIRKIIDLPDDCMRIARDPSTGKVYFVRSTGDIYEVNIEAQTSTLAYRGATTGAMSFGGGGGFTIANDGTFFVVSDPRDSLYDHGLIVRGKMVKGIRVWDTVAVTVPYLIPGGRDHRFNSIIVTLDQKYLIVNSGSRTDHGEAVIGGREFPITSAMFKIPINAKNLILYNNVDSLRPYLYVDGVRNSFDMAYTPSGDLIATENSDTRDDPEELNWIQEGHNYGFPWRLSTNDNPQQFPNYNPPDSDPLLGPTNMESTFHNDPDFPPKPDSIVFTDPILNVGPDDDKFRDTDRVVKDASQLGIKLGTLTPHSSPLAIVFDTAFALSSDYAGDGFFMGYSSHSATKSKPFNEPGEDLLHIKLNKIEAEDRYEVSVHRIAVGFSNPVDAVLIGNKYYVLETGSGSSLWEVTLPSKVTSINSKSVIPLKYSLEQNYPNPFNPSTKINYSIAKTEHVSIKVYDILGNEVETLVDKHEAPGHYELILNGSQLSSGVYIYKIEAGPFAASKKMILLK
jgi:Secretion system C-terminal sorting domain/Glucose / Sorbosone dehydrogenase